MTFAPQGTPPSRSPDGDQPRIWLTESAGGWASPGFDDCRDFHLRLPGYLPTPLRKVPELASQLGVAAVLIKDESARLGLPAFKILGASWGVYRALSERAGSAPPAWRTLADLGRHFAALPEAKLLAATDGNHGRAVAHMARLLGLQAVILVPATAGPQVRQAIAAEGADVVIINGNYDEAVAAAAALAARDQSHVLVQDTAWPGYERVPAWIVEGYHTMFLEIDDQLAAAGHAPPDLAVVPAGVGSLLSAATMHYRAASRRGRTAILAVEPDTAACVQASLRAGRPVTVPTGVTVMEGLNCGTVSFAAWPVICGGVDAAVAVTDAEALTAVSALRDLGVPAGPCGAATLAGLYAALACQPAGLTTDQVRQVLRLTPASVIVLLSTEGSRSPAVKRAP